MRKTTIPLETIIELRSLLSGLPNRSSQRKALIKDTAELYGVSTQTVYRNLQQHNLPRSTRRADYGQPRVMPKPAAILILEKKGNLVLYFCRELTLIRDNFWLNYEIIDVERRENPNL